MVQQLSINEVARLQCVNTSTIVRWWRRGIITPGQRRDPSPARIHLRMRRVGGRVYCTQEDLDAFLAALNAPPEDDHRAPQLTAAQRETMAETADRVLAQQLG